MTLKQKLRKKTSMENLICKFIHTKYLKKWVRSPLSKICYKLCAYFFGYPHRRLTIAGKSLRSEPKHIVFSSQLLVLFNFCHICKADIPSVGARQMRTKAIVTSTCCNPKCPKPVNNWHSQPKMPDSGIAAGNFLLCMAILLAGGSASKVFQIFAHMGLGCVSLNTSFKCQRVRYRVQYTCIKDSIIVY